MMNQYPQQPSHSNSSGQRYIGQNSQEQALQRPLNAAGKVVCLLFFQDFEQRGINSLQGHHAQPVADIPVGMFNQPENTHSSFHTSHHYYPPFAQNRSPQNRDDVELTPYYGTVPISGKYSSVSAAPQQPQFSNAPENVNGPKDPISTSGPPPTKRKRGRPALFPSSDNGNNYLIESSKH